MLKLITIYSSKQAYSNLYNSVTKDVMGRVFY